jgi:ABC-type Fe3+/spermidine/putrescine transport system ATPase subunit
MSVFENVAFGLRFRKISKGKIMETVQDVLRLVRLEGLDKRKPSQLSGGQQQRVALARALVLHPEALLLDEPLSNLDRKLRNEMRLEIRRIQRELGITTIFVTHDQEEALTMSDRVAVMSKGQIEQVGKPSEVYERPTSAFVAEFVGETNFFIGKIKEVVGNLAVMQTKGGIQFKAIIPENHRLNLRTGDDVKLIVRPERVAISKSHGETTDKENMLQGTIDEIVFLGPLISYRIKLFDGLSMRITDKNYGKPLYSTSENVFLKISPNDLSLVPNDFGNLSEEAIR